MIVDKIDGDRDGVVTTEELKQWIEYTQKRYISDDVKRQWNSHNPKNKPEIVWDEYKSLVYGFLESRSMMFIVAHFIFIMYYLSTVHNIFILIFITKH